MKAGGLTEEIQYLEYHRYDCIEVLAVKTRGCQQLSEKQCSQEGQHSPNSTFVHQGLQGPVAKEAQSIREMHKTQSNRLIIVSAGRLQLQQTKLQAKYQLLSFKTSIPARRNQSQERIQRCQKLSH